jgi:hypothetical protein
MSENVGQGAATTVWAAIGKEWEEKGGKCLTECTEAESGEDSHDMTGVGYANHVYDPEREARLSHRGLASAGEHIIIGIPLPNL